MRSGGHDRAITRSPFYPGIRRFSRRSRDSRCRAGYVRLQGNGAHDQPHDADGRPGPSCGTRGGQWNIARGQLALYLLVSRGRWRLRIHKQRYAPARNTFG